MLRDFAAPLWLLKLGALLNLYLLFRLGILDSPENPAILLPAQILLIVSAYRCLFPNRYKDNIVLHDSFFSSTFLIRLLATFAEVAFIFQFSEVLRQFNQSGSEWILWISWFMVLQVSISQGFVWWAILSRQLIYYYYEEIGWFLIFVANTAASAYLLVTVALPQPHGNLLQLNLVFGAFYLPWQILHIRALHNDARTAHVSPQPDRLSARMGLSEALFQRQRRTAPEAWGGWIGLVWMIAYWASLIPLWVHHVARTLNT